MVRAEELSRVCSAFSCIDTAFLTWQVQGMERLVAQESLNKYGARCTYAELLILFCFIFQKKTLASFSITIYVCDLE